MSKKQLAWLFLDSLGYWTVGNGLIQLLPVYATKLGANSAVAGYYLNERPHSSLGYQTPAGFGAAWRLLSGTLEQSPQREGVC